MTAINKAAVSEPTSGEVAHPVRAQRQTAKGKRHDIDELVGKRIKMRREELGLSQSDLGRRLGVAFQQVQKYEKGINRVSAGALAVIANALRCEISYFFPPTDATTSQPDFGAHVDNYEALRLVRAFAHVPDAKMRESIITLIEGIAAVEAIRSPQQAHAANGASAPLPTDSPRSGGI